MEAPVTAEVKTVFPDVLQSVLEAGPAKRLDAVSFPYHNWEGHVLPTRDKAAELGLKMGLSGDDRRLLEISALLHDIRLPEGRVGHEDRSAVFAEELLKGLGESENNREKEARMIRGTKGRMVDDVYVYEPSDDPLVLALRDADQSNVGDTKYPQLNESLRMELGVEDKAEWTSFQIRYLTKHRFQTREAQDLWGEQKRKNLDYLEAHHASRP
jgi:predicted metal-dependent HD superfamily phosphohydrolase